MFSILLWKSYQGYQPIEQCMPNDLPSTVPFQDYVSGCGYLATDAEQKLWIEEVVAMCTNIVQTLSTLNSVIVFVPPIASVIVLKGIADFTQQLQYVSFFGTIPCFSLTILLFFLDCCLNVNDRRKLKKRRAQAIETANLAESKDSETISMSDIQTTENVNITKLEKEKFIYP